MIKRPHKDVLSILDFFFNLSIYLSGVGVFFVSVYLFSPLKKNCFVCLFCGDVFDSVSITFFLCNRRCVNTAKFKLRRWFVCWLGDAETDDGLCVGWVMQKLTMVCVMIGRCRN